MARSTNASRLLLVAAIAAACGVSFWLGRAAMRQQAPPLAEGDELADDRALLIAVQNLARLETVAYHMERIVDLKNRQSRFFGLVEAEDALLLIAVGDVVAGVDLAQMQPDDVRIDPQTETATITLPPPIILSARLDSSRTRLRSRETDLLAKRVEALETRAREQAEHSIEQAAIEAGILRHATKNAELTLRALVVSLGYRNVVVHHRDSRL